MGTLRTAAVHLGNRPCRCRSCRLARRGRQCSNALPCTRHTVGGRLLVPNGRPAGLGRHRALASQRFVGRTHCETPRRFGSPTPSAERTLRPTIALLAIQDRQSLRRVDQCADDTKRPPFIHQPHRSSLEPSHCFLSFALGFCLPAPAASVVSAGCTLSGGVRGGT